MQIVTQSTDTGLHGKNLKEYKNGLLHFTAFAQTAAAHHTKQIRFFKCKYYNSRNLITYNVNFTYN